jgi:hypothetical protein
MSQVPAAIGRSLSGAVPRPYTSHGPGAAARTPPSDEPRMKLVFCDMDSSADAAVSCSRRGPERSKVRAQPVLAHISPQGSRARTADWSGGRENRPGLKERAAPGAGTTVSHLPVA